MDHSGTSRPKTRRKTVCTDPSMGAHGLTASEITKLRPHAPLWMIHPRRGVPRLQRTFACRSFSEAMWFTLKIGELAEREGQRPMILTDWDQVTVVLRTPNTAGLHRNDFIMAAQVDAFYEERPGTKATPADA